MPAIDQCEPQVIRAFEKAGWIIINQPFTIRVAAHEGIIADLRLQSTITAEEIIVIEVKCFADERSWLDDFYRAVGQYLVYRNGTALLGLSSPLFLAIPNNVYETFFQRKMIQATIKDVKYISSSLRWSERKF